MDDLLKWVVSIAAAALLGTLILIGVLPKPAPDTNTSSSVIESGSFIVQQNGISYGREDFILSLTGDQSDLHSTVDLEHAGRATRFTQRLRMTTDLDPVRYFRDTPDESNAVLLEFQGNEVQANVFSNGQAQAQRYTGVAPFVVLDRDVFSHYLLLYRHIQNQNGRFSGTVILPQTSRMIEPEILSTNPINLRTGTRAIQVERLTLQVGEVQVVLYAQDEELIAVGLPDQQIFAYRSDMFPEALQAP